MSLILSNRVTRNQLKFLHELGYYGDTDISVNEAARLIDELIEQQRDEQDKAFIEFEGERFEVF